MILGSLKNTERIEEIYPAFKPFFDYVKANDLCKVEPGKIELDGKNLFIVHTLSEGKKVENARLESHRQYIDIQLVLENTEAMGWKTLAEAEEVTIPYSEEKDIMFFAGESDEIINVQPGQFMIFFPEDLHAPGIGEGPIRKLIGKVKIQ